MAEVFRRRHRMYDWLMNEETRMGEAPRQTPRDAPAEPGSLSFEVALQQLEDIVKALEGGKGTLAQAISDYERGAALRRHCEAQLAEAEMKVQAIVGGPAGSPPTLRDVE
jgi:exodeoxyribonuclease VII small subunit